MQTNTVTTTPKRSRHERKLARQQYERQCGRRQGNGSRRGDADEIAVKLRRSPEPRVVGLEQHADVLRQVDAEEGRLRKPRRERDDVASGSAAQLQNAGVLQSSAA